MIFLVPEETESASTVNDFSKLSLFDSTNTNSKFYYSVTY